MNAARFTKRARLLKAAQFDVAFKQGRRLNAGVFTAVIAPNELGFARLGFAFSKRHAPHSVQRNRVRRILRERFRQQQQALSAVDLVLMLRSKLPVEPMALTAAVNAFWTQLAARCAAS